VNPFDEDFLRALSRLEIAIARTRARSGEGGRRGGRRGGRVEFAGHRPYSPGDDVRFIDWSAHARTGRLHVKEFEREEELDVVVVVDASASMTTHGKFDSARRLAYALGWLALRGEARVRAGLAADGALRLSETAAGVPGAETVRRMLADADAHGGTRLSESLAKLPGSSRGTRIVFLVSDLLGADDGRRALAALSERGDDVVVLQVLAPGDFAEADSGDVVLEDAETGERVPVDPAAPDRAREYASRREREWGEFAARHRVRWVPVDASAPLDVNTVRALRAAGVLT
jgi:uncharacterized protein (DUF58 family)